MITKVRVIKEGDIYKIQEYDEYDWTVGWHYLKDNKSNYISFKTEKEAKDYIEKKYIKRLIKEYDIVGLKDK